MRQRALVVAAVALSLLMSTCKESLPEYRSPGSLYFTHFYPFYVLKPDENALHIYIVVRNMYEETLDGVASFKGQIGLVSTKDAGITKTFSLGPGSVRTARGYAGGRWLTFDPRDSIVCEVVWDLKQRPLLDDLGRDLTQGLLRLVDDRECPSVRQRSAAEDFIVQGFIELFDKSAPAVSRQMVYRFCLVSHWVDPKVCPVVSEPCNTIVAEGPQ